MKFNSIEFVVFFLLFLILWKFCKKNNLSRWILITISSLVFYAWWDWRFVFLLVFSGIVDYTAGILIFKRLKFKKLFLVISLLVNLGLLSIFKYTSFFISVIQDIFSFFSINLLLETPLQTNSLILPLGISFYTFQSMSYTIDIYRGRLKPTQSLLHFFSYLVMFPQLVAGPIVRAKDFLKQLESYKIISSVTRWHALKMICYGFFRKVVIADNLAYMIDKAYEGKATYDGTLFWWVITIAFSFQIYNDFSGYSLIARGLAKYMGYHFKMNFNHPYLSTSFKDFWKRWHISLSTWFRDYVYIPLGGSHNTFLKTLFALSATMMLSGLWHGANYTFLIWALLHTFYLLFERILKKYTSFKVPKLISIVIVFILINISWIYFRSQDIHEANFITKKLFSFTKTDLGFISRYFDNLFFLVLAIGIECLYYVYSKYSGLKAIYNKYNLDIVSVVGSLLLILFFRGEAKQFIYFQF